MNLVQLVGDPFKVFPQWSRSAALCEDCMKRFVSWKFGPYDHEGIQRGGEPAVFSFSLGREALVLSVESGCSLCTIAMHTLHLHPGVEELCIKYQMLNTNPQKDPSNLDLFRVQEAWRDATGKEHQTSYDFWMYAARDNPAGKYFRTRDVNPAVGSQSAYEQAQRWIKECSESHKDCQSLKLSALPTRVIDVHPFTANGDPRLFITEGLEAPYAALSYCWGSKQPNSLLGERLPDFVKCIPRANLPQTIRDAITVTANLGLRYLWVDSMCIIQDSSTDKRKEISKMREIFRNALVTISAASARSVFEGFLHPRAPPVPSVCIPLRCPDGSSGEVSLYLDGEEPHLVYTEGDHPIESRAWTLEEKVLSRRILVYSSTHLRWLCDSSQYGDGGAQENFMDYMPAKYRLPLRRREAPSHPSQNNISSGSLHNSWRVLLAEFTKRSLTAQEDKLRAIAGLAEEYQQLMNDTYHAGLWESELVTELLWRRNSLSKSGPLFPRPVKYRAPSWSWASVDSEVAIRQKAVERVKFEVVECVTTPISNFAPFGEVSSGILQVRARMRAAWWDPTAEDVFDRDGGLRLGKGIPDAFEENTSTSCTVNALAVSANHGLILIPTESGGDVYHRLGWLYFDNDTVFDECEEKVVTMV